MSAWFGPVEVAPLRWYGWGWHCYRCEETHLRLDRETATRQAQEHARQHGLVGRR